MSKRWPISWLLALLALGHARADLLPATVDDCSLDGPPLCYERAARRSGAWDLAGSRLRQRLARNPDDDAAHYALGQLLSDRDLPGVETHWQSALAGCVSRGLAACEVRVTLALSQWYSIQGRLAESERYLQQARSAARRTDNEIAQLMVEVQTARLETTAGRHAESVARLESLESRVSATKDDEAQSDWLGALAVALWGVGRIEDSLARFQALRLLHEQQGDRFSLSQTLHNVVLLMSAVRGEVEPEARALLQQALRLATESGNQRSEVSIRLSLAQDQLLTWNDRSLHLDIAMRAASAGGRIEDLCFALRLKSQYSGREAGEGDQAAIIWAERGLRCAQESGNPFQLARAHLVYAQRLWDANDLDQGIAAGTVALDAIERIRDLQPDSQSRASTFGRWVFFYERFIGMVLGNSKAPSTQSIEMALTIAERRRARTLLDQLDSVGGTTRVAERHPASAPREALLFQASNLQRRLSSGSLSRAERAELRTQLTRAESDATLLARDIAADDTTFSQLRLPSIPRLDQLQRALADDEALLAYLVPGTGQYGSRPLVFVLTRSTARVEFLTLKAVSDRVSLFGRLLERRDDSDIQAAQRFYRDLLGAALSSLPAQITHLTVIPDGAIARLPWGALRDDAGQPLATRYAISLAPSASLWFSWRQQPALSSSTALVFSDPTPADDSRGKDLPRLPSARSEALWVAQIMGARSRLFAGVAASEHALRYALDASGGLVHIAAHTVIDERHPEKSAIALTPGGGEDGWLEERELVGLDLKGRCMVLSSCAGAGGAELAGEGTLSLARACFLGGARAVVAAAAPVRDDEARRVMEPFFRGLAEGLSVADALAAAQRERFAAKDATYGWASVTVYGDGRWKMQPSGRPASRSTLGIVMAASIAVSALTLVLKIR